MIFIFHSLYFVFKFALKIYKKHKALKEFERCKEERLLEESNHQQFDIEECLQFDPPVYRQRYSAVQQILLDDQWRKEIKRIVDFGCAEFGFFTYMKHLFGVNEILEVDIDEDLLKENKFRIQPLTADFLKQRCEPLVVNIFCGSIGDPDYRLKNVDAVVAIEIVEHLYPDTLDQLTYNIFGYMKPRIAIFTTPNADFNVLFPNFKGIRHDDHKFEWTRSQFSDWAHNIIQRFPEFSLKIEGVGKGPKGTETLGCCSQMAIFVREYFPLKNEMPDVDFHCESGDSNESYGVCTYYSYSNHLAAFNRTDSSLHCDSSKPNTYYKLIESISYPYAEDKRSQEQKILDEALYCIYRNATANSRFYNEETDTVEIPLFEMVHNFEGFFTTETEIKRILEEAEFLVKECTPYGSTETQLCVVYDIEMDRQSSANTSNENKSEYEYTLNTSDDTGSDWELECRADVPPMKLKTETCAEDVGEPSDQLFDSGYQKSISNAEWSPQSPLDGTFEEQFNASVKLDVNDIKESARVKIMEELRTEQINNKILSEKRCASTSSKKSPRKESLPSTSSDKRRHSAHFILEELDDECMVKKDVENITNCIVYNSLNKLQIDDEIIEEPIPLPVLLPVPPEIPYIVENGDLANNNRDNEGNNYPDEVPQPQPFDVDYVDDDLNENRENVENLVLPEENENVNEENRNYQEIGEAVALPMVPEVQERLEEDPQCSNVEVESLNLNHASREALFDPDSQQDMLDDMSIPESQTNTEPEAEEEDANRYDSINILTAQHDIGLQESEFPNWLLQMLGQPSEDEDRDEPHFYCQGDGLGVHPSIIEVDAEDSSSDTSSDDAAEAEPTISENDAHPLPVDINNIGAQQAVLEVVGINIPLHITRSAVSNDSNEEFFDTIDDNCQDEERK